MQCPTVYTEFSDSELSILPSQSRVRDEMDDATLDDLYAVEDTEIDDFQRGGK